MEEAEKRARMKLNEIIAREGTSNGERLKPYYLAALIDEAELEMEAERVYAV